MGENDKNFFFIDRSAFDKTFSDLDNEKAPRIRISALGSIFLTLLITILTTKEYYISIFNISSENIKLFLIIVEIVLFILYVFFLLLKLYYRKSGKTWEVLDVNKVKDILEKNAEELNKYTILLLIPDFREEKITLLAKRHTNWEDAIFVPYINYSSKENFTELVGLDEEMHKRIITHIKFKYEYLPGMDIYNEIKYHKDEECLRRYNYKFFLVYPKSNFLFDYFINDLKKEGYDFFTIENMKMDMNSMLRNADVIKQIFINQHNLKNKFSLLNRSSNRLVWNISENCDHKCEFCAFGNSERKLLLQMPDIDRVIDNLGKIKIDIIDISTGDIIDINYLKECIVKLNKAGYKISLTATSKIINSFDIDFILTNLSMIEFSYDSLDSDSHRSKGYNDSNYLCIKKISNDIRKMSKEQNKKAIALKALIIIYSHMTFKLFKNIISKLEKVNVKDATIIRLMPVGLMAEKKYPEKLLDKKTYNEYLEFSKRNPKIVPHCSFDGLTAGITYCNKGISKLGMNPLGEIYSCPWGEHLIGNSKYYLGNIFDDDIIEILNRQDFSNMENNKFLCEIFNSAMNKDSLYE
jgi:hypothetical protein